MYNPWVDASLLVMQSGSVVCLRVLKIVGGGTDAHAESERMVAEKLTANVAAAVTLMTGGSMQAVIAGYREVVEANNDRLLIDAAASLR